MFLRHGTHLTKEYWDGLTTKDALYDAFDKMPEHERVTFNPGCYNVKPDMPLYYKDGEFKEVAQKLKKAAEPLLPILRDIVKHLPAQTSARFRVSADGQSSKEFTKSLITNIRPSDPDSLACIAWFVLLALEDDTETSLIKQIKIGCSIPEARAAFRAYGRYAAFKEEDAAKQKAFEQTSEYHKQLLEIKFGLRKEIEIPEE